MTNAVEYFQNQLRDIPTIQRGVVSAVSLGGEVEK